MSRRTEPTHRAKPRGRVEVQPNELAPGTYDLSVIRETDEAIIVCANGHTITVK